MRRALAEFRVRGPGVHTTSGFLGELVSDPVFQRGEHTTAIVETVSRAWARRPAGPGRDGRWLAGQSSARRAA